MFSKFGILESLKTEKDRRKNNTHGYKQKLIFQIISLVKVNFRKKKELKMFSKMEMTPCLSKADPH